MIDVKKFVVAFLIIAALASTSALFLLNSGGAVSPPPASKQPFTAIASGETAASLGNVFASNQMNNAPAVPNGTTSAAPSNPNNLTDQLAGSFVSKLVVANPNGIQNNGDGTATISTPSVNSVLSGLATSSAVANLVIPDWDFEAAMQTVRVATDTSDAAVAQYGQALAGIVNNDFLQTDLQGIVQNGATADLSKLSYAASEIGNALQDVGGLTAPQNFADFQKSFLKLLVYEKNTLTLGASPSDDPARTALIFQGESDKYQSAIASFQAQWQKAMQNKSFALALGPAPEKKNGVVAFVNTLFDIHEAHAQFGGITFDPSVFAQIVWEFAQGVLLQILKNTLITLIENKVLAMITGGGNPKFIQSWTMLASNAFNGAVGSAMGQILPGLCPNFSPTVSAWLQSSFSNANIMPGGFSMNGAAATNCTLQTAIPNIGAFATNFNSAGFTGFDALLSPNNNPFGTFAQAYDQLQGMGSSMANAAQSKSIAGSGSPGQPLCDDGSTPNPGDGNVCDDGSEPFTVTPGNSFMDTLGRNLNSNIDLVVNATDITGVLATVTSALLQQLLNAGLNGLVGLPGAGMGAAGAGTGAPPQPTPPATPLVCNAPIQNTTAGSTVYFSVTGGANTGNYTWNAPGGNPATGASQAFTTVFAFPGTYIVTVTSIGTVNATVNCPAVTVK